MRVRLCLVQPEIHFLGKYVEPVEPFYGCRLGGYNAPRDDHCIYYIYRREANEKCGEVWR